jgi:hypothetical protein
VGKIVRRFSASSSWRIARPIGNNSFEELSFLGTFVHQIQNKILAVRLEGGKNLISHLEAL